MTVFPISPYPLAQTPTPIQKLERLSRQLGGPDIWIKRDDYTGLGLGGNKVRKLEFLVAEALSRGADTLITAGPLQSNHCRQTAAAAAVAGLACILVIEDRVEGTSELYRTNGNLLLDRLFGARFHVLPGGADIATALDDVAQRTKHEGHVPYVIPVGASNPVGALGYVKAVDEIIRQSRELDVHFDHIVHATGSGGTQAGLTAGVELADAAFSIHGVNILDEPGGRIAERVRAIADTSIELTGRSLASVRRREVSVVDGYVGEAFGKPTAGMIEAVTRLGALEGVILDPVHTGKAMAGLIDLVSKKRFHAGETVLFIHTGGLPSVFAYAPLWSAEPIYS